MLTESEIKAYTVDIPNDIQAAQRASGCASVNGSAPLVELQRNAEAYEREAAEMWQLVDEYTALAERAQNRAEEAYEKLQDAMALNDQAEL